jgi:hypothetical protein
MDTPEDLEEQDRNWLTYMATGNLVLEVMKHAEVVPNDPADADAARLATDYLRFWAERKLRQEGE